MQIEQGVPSQDTPPQKTETLAGALVPGQSLITSVADAVSSILPLTEQIDKAVAGFSQKMGSGVELTASLKKNLSEGAQSVIGLGGTFENAKSIQTEFSDIFSKNIVLAADTYGQMYATSQVTGVATKTLYENFADAGIATKNIAKEMRTVVEIAQSLGVNATAVSSRVTQNLDKLNKFGFQGGIEGLARMAAQSAILRTNMDSVFNIAEDLMSPEKAIEMSSALQRLGATTTSLVDPLKLMDLAQNDVGELQNQLGQLFKQYTTFDEKTQKFQIMPSARRDLKMIAQELGMSVDEVTKFAIGTADIEKKLSEISFGGLDIDEDTQNMIANMATMGEGGEYEITTKDGSVQTLDSFLQKYQGKEDELKKYFESEAAAAEETPEDKMLAQGKEQLGSLGQINATLNEVKNAVGLAFGGSKAGQATLDLAKKNVEIQTEDFLKNFSTKSDAFVSGLDKLATDLNLALKNNDLGGAVNGITGFMDTLVGQSKETLTGVLTKYGDAFNFDINIKEISDKITNIFNSITENGKSVGVALNSASETIKSAMGGLSDVANIIKDKIGIKDGILDFEQGKVLVANKDSITPFEFDKEDKFYPVGNNKILATTNQPETFPKKEQNNLSEIINSKKEENNLTNFNRNENTNFSQENNNTLTKSVNDFSSSLTNTNQSVETLYKLVQNISEQKPKFDIKIPNSSLEEKTKTKDIEEQNTQSQSVTEKISKTLGITFDEINKITKSEVSPTTNIVDDFKKNQITNSVNNIDFSSFIKKENQINKEDNKLSESITKLNSVVEQTKDKEVNKEDNKLSESITKLNSVVEQTTKENNVDEISISNLINESTIKNLMNVKPFANEIQKNEMIYEKNDNFNTPKINTSQISFDNYKNEKLNNVLTTQSQQSMLTVEGEAKIQHEIIFKGNVPPNINTAEFKKELIKVLAQNDIGTKVKQSGDNAFLGQNVSTPNKTPYMTNV